MRKKFIKIFVLILMLVAFVPISNVRAASNSYKYKNAYYDISNYTNYKEFYITKNKKHTSDGKFWIHQAYSGNTYIHAYCLNVGKYADTNKCSDLKRKDFNWDNTHIKEDKRNLLKKVLSVAPYLTGNLCSGTGCKKTKYKSQVIAAQIIVWEIVEGARTSFDTIQPNEYHEANSAYKRFIQQNDVLKDAYKKIIKDVQSNEKESIENTAFTKEEAYILAWDGERYTKNVGNVGKYKTCSSSDEDVKFKVESNGTLKVSTKKDLNKEVTITCKYTTGESSNSADYYDFDESSKDCNSGYTYQDLIKASQSYTYSAKLKVKTSSKQVRITKLDDSGKTITGAKFRLSLNGNLKDTANVYTFDLTKSLYADVKVKKTGRYLLQEITTPTGKQKIPDTYITINVEEGTAAVSGGGGLIKTNSANNLIYISVINTSKMFSINKVNQSGQAVKGATFQIRKGNTPMNFSWDGSKFVYQIAGSFGKDTTNIVNSNISNYLITGLPDGDYSLVEVAAPYPYVLSSSESDRTIKFRIKNGDMYVYSSSSKSYSTSSSLSINVKNYTTKVVINKIGNDGVKLSGIKFYLWDSTKTKKIKSVLTSANSGNYNYDTSQNSGVEEYVTNSNGQIVINALPAGTYYFEEFDTGDTDYPVPEGEDALTKIEIKVTSSGVTVNNSTSGQITISNALNQFNFYKIDEDGNYLTGGSFKIQKYNSKTGQYNDIAIESANSDNNSDIYKVSSKGDKFIFTIKNGVVTFKEVESSARYRIVEIEAPDGFTKSNIEDENQLIIEVNSKGYVKSNTTLVNKKVDLKEDAQASAELIINISTGQNRIHYILIISILLLIITGLIVISRKMRKK